MQSCCMFGDSLAKGVVYDAAREKYTVLKDGFASLLARISGVKIENYAKFGATLIRSLPLIEKHLPEIGRFDGTLLEFGGNDCNFDWASVAESPDSPHAPAVPLAEFEARYDGVVKSILKNGGRPIIATLPPLHAERFYRWVSKGLDEAAILRFLGDVEYIYRWQEMYSLTACQVAARNNVPVADLRRTLLLRNDYGDYLCEDGMHLNSRGHALIAESLLSQWKQAG